MNTQQRSEIYDCGHVVKPLFACSYPKKAGDMLAIILFKAVNGYDFSDNLTDVAEMLGVDEKTIRRSLKWLEDKGLITKTKGGGGLRRDGTGFTNRYVLNDAAILEEAQKWKRDNMDKLSKYGGQNAQVSYRKGGQNAQQPRTKNSKRYSFDPNANTKKMMDRGL